MHLWNGARRIRCYDKFAHGPTVDAVVTAGTHALEVVSLHAPGQESASGLVEGYYLVQGLLHAPGPTNDKKHNECVFITETLSTGIEQAQLTMAGRCVVAA